MSNKERHVDTPELVFDTSSTGNEFYIDAMNCELERLSANVHLLSYPFEIEGDRLSDAVVVNSLWGIQGQVETLKKLLHMAHMATRSKAK